MVTDFEKQLSQVFPDIFRLHVFGKSRPRIWKTVYVLMDMMERSESGEIRIFMGRGKIERVTKMQDISDADSGVSLGSTNPSQID